MLNRTAVSNWRTDVCHRKSTNLCTRNITCNKQYMNKRIGEPGRCSRQSDEPRAGRFGVRIPAKANSHLQNSPDRHWGPLLNGYRGFSQGEKQPWSEVDSDLPNADVKNERSYTSTFCKCLHGVDRDSFTEVAIFNCVLEKLLFFVEVWNGKRTLPILDRRRVSFGFAVSRD